MDRMTPQQVITLTELQKLSLKKLRNSKLGERPLLVIDRKTGIRAFVIIDYRAFERLTSVELDVKPRSKKGASSFDFHGRGLLWDRPQMTNREFAKALSDPDHLDHVWAISRLFERLISDEILKLFSISDIRAMLGRTRVRGEIRRAWENAIEYWGKKA